ncbi:helix-turn-helix domain-containing protein [Azohydromonas lata]|uniref:Helix-turn-helix domain-containing protein n=1 Tax=Azohydromonas lata TaxID=45677 RepID=A0ABU5IHM7_9BURK|nr:helix-turn-helix domain-containing protein [Azohydromonas lata]MDZ5458657.1 helix-turn-helix domain-containing protein [Azohydromonas lata]
MDKLDARKFSEETLQVLRRQADRLRREGWTWDEIAAIVGINRSAVLNWHKRYGIGEAGVLGDVSSSKRGARSVIAER